MTELPYRTALIVGAGAGISASVARALAAAGLKLGLAARNIDKLAPLAAETGAERFAADASDPAAVAQLFEEADARLGSPDVVLYNASARAPGSVAEIDPEAVRKAIEISAFGAAFAMGKFALRGLAQSTARELGPKGIHVAHFIIDGGVRSARRPDPPNRPDSTLDPDAIAQTYLEVLRQPRSAWSLEVEMRPWVETF